MTHTVAGYLPERSAPHPCPQNEGGHGDLLGEEQGLGTPPCWATEAMALHPGPAARAERADSGLGPERSAGWNRVERAELTALTAVCLLPPRC